MSRRAPSAEEITALNELDEDASSELSDAVPVFEEEEIHKYPDEFPDNDNPINIYPPSGNRPIERIIINTATIPKPLKYDMIGSLHLQILMAGVHPDLKIVIWNPGEELSEPPRELIEFLSGIDVPQKSFQLVELYDLSNIIPILNRPLNPIAAIDLSQSGISNDGLSSLTQNLLNNINLQSIDFGNIEFDEGVWREFLAVKQDFDTLRVRAGINPIGINATRATPSQHTALPLARTLSEDQLVPTL